MLLILFYHLKAAQSIHFHDNKPFAITLIPLPQTWDVRKIWITAEPFCEYQPARKEERGGKKVGFAISRADSYPQPSSFSCHFVISLTTEVLFLRALLDTNIICCQPSSPSKTIPWRLSPVLSRKQKENILPPLRCTWESSDYRVVKNCCFWALLRARR